MGITFVGVFELMIMLDRGEELVLSVGVDDWLKLFPKETWPQSTVGPEMIWPEPAQQAAADERGIIIKPNCMKPTNYNTCLHFLV